MNVSLVVHALPPRLQRVADYLVEALMAAMALFMAIWGTRLCEATWGNTIADFPFLSTGVTYLPIPIGGTILLLFVIEHVTLGRPKDLVGDAHSVAAFE
jgi:TRAP-type C4-dicarboxylate transport system permease small subunit